MACGFPVDVSQVLRSVARSAGRADTGRLEDARVEEAGVQVAGVEAAGVEVAGEGRRCQAAYVPEDDTYVFDCPRCGVLIQVARAETNCRIFRHAVYAGTVDPIPPHTPRDECERLVAGGLVVGCAGPFRLVLEADPPYAEACGYI